MYRYAKPWFSAQADRGWYYQKIVFDPLNFKMLTTGIRPFVGLQW